MPLTEIAGTVAVETLKGNDFSSWPARGDPQSRLEPIAQPSFAIPFQLELGEPVFTIGSCFARNVENALAERGFALPARSVIRDVPEFGAIGFNVLNNYGVSSIYNEIRWALSPDAAPDDAHLFFELFPGRYVDVHLNHALRPMPLELVRARRAAIRNAYARIADCRIIIMTLGLAEVWYDNEVGIYLNTAPRRAMVRQMPDRFSVRVMDYYEVHDILERTFVLIEKHCRSDAQVLLTVSPVPLQSTYRDMDVMVANFYSKSVLRTAAERICTDHDFVFYYPSYESIMLSERGAAWQDDNVHPTIQAIRLNCERLVQACLTNTTGSIDADHVRLRAPSMPSGEILALLEQRQDLIEGHPDLALLYCEAALKGRNAAAAERVLPLADAALEAPGRMLLKARISLDLDRPAEALALLTAEPAKRSQRIQFHALRTKALLSLRRLDDAREPARHWYELNQRSTEPFREMGAACSFAGLIDRADNYFRQALERADDEPALLLDYVEHLQRSGRADAAEQFLAHVDPTNPSHVLRMERLRSDLM